MSLLGVNYDAVAVIWLGDGEHASGARDVRRDAVHDCPAAGSVAHRPRAPRRPRQRRGGRGIVGARRRHFPVEFSLFSGPR